MAQSRLLSHTREKYIYFYGYMGILWLFIFYIDQLERAKASCWPWHTQAEFDPNDLLAKGWAPETPSYSFFQLPKSFPRYFSMARTGQQLPLTFPVFIWHRAWSIFIQALEKLIYCRLGFQAKIHISWVKNRFFIFKWLGKKLKKSFIIWKINEFETPAFLNNLFTYCL